MGFLAPQAVGLYLTALYNFAITGSVRPDALFLAWGPGGVTTARMGQGLLGILLDARYGILPYVPLLVLAAAGLLLGGARRFALVLPAAAVYYLTVASADNWAGAVCNLGRYFMPVAPLAIALVAVALDRALAPSWRPGPGGDPGRLVGPLRPRPLERPPRGQRLGAAAGDQYLRRREPVHPQPQDRELGGAALRVCGPGSEPGSW